MHIVFAFSSLEFYVVAVPAVILLGLSKGGFTGVGLLSLPLLALVAPPLQAAAILLPIVVIQNGVGAWAYRHHLDRRNICILLPSAIVGTFAGYVLAAWVSTAVVAIFIGVVSVVFGVLQLWPRHRVADTVIAPANIPMGLLVGTLAGFINMIAQAGGPPVLMYLLHQRVPRDVLVGTSVFLFTIINLARVVPFLALGWFTGNTLFDAMLLMPLAIASTWWGVLLVRRTSGPLFYRIAYALLLGVGAKLVYDGLVAVL